MSQRIALFSGVKRSRTLIYLLGFLLGLHMALPAYLYSTFLSQFVPERFVGLLFAFASLATILLFTQLPKILKAVGNFTVSLAFLMVALISAAWLSIAIDAPTAIVLFVTSYLASSILIFTFDVFLEHVSRDGVTGVVRGTYLVFVSASWIVGQVITSFIVSDSHYTQILLLSAVVVIPMLFIVVETFKRFNDPHYANLHLFKFFTSPTRHRAVLSAYLAAFLLQFFYVWMVIYTPLYLHNHLGFSWSTVALIFSVMLIPFVIIPRPIGKIADRWLGEKEFLVAGFLIMAISTGAMAFLASASALVWALVLFASRIGASAVETMSETYFFKHVSERDISLIGVFRSTRPWAYVIAPVVATVTLSFIGIQYLFLVLGLILLYGAFKATHIKDTL